MTRIRLALAATGLVGTALFGLAAPASAAAPAEHDAYFSCQSAGCYLFIQQADGHWEGQWFAAWW